MTDLNISFWETIEANYPTEITQFLNYINRYMDDFVISHMELFRMSVMVFPKLPPALQLGLFLQYTMQHEHKQDWFRTKGHGSVTEQVERWFEMEHRRNSNFSLPKKSVYPTFL